MGEPLNAMQMKLLEVHSQGDFAHLSIHDKDRALEIAKSKSTGDLLLAYMLAELGQAEDPEDGGDQMEKAAAILIEIGIAMDTLR